MDQKEFKTVRERLVESTAFDNLADRKTMRDLTN